MDLWLNIALPDLLKLLKRVDALVLNESEAQQLTKTDNLRLAAERIHRLGPAWVIIKKGSHGAMLSGPDGFFLAPAYPLRKVVDPTGAGDSFVGGLTGYLASSEGGIKRNLRRAVMVGTVVASFCCEGFGLQRTDRLKLSEIEQRLAELEQMCRF
jgi:sugar/nucleoside kinase (ribokinase family)